VISISSRQRETGVYGEAIWQPGRWSAALSARGDWFSTFDAKSTLSTTGAVTPEPMVSEAVVSPRLGLVRELGHGLSLTGSVNRAFRGPTMNELYRTGQVGQQTTLPNAALLSERATGFEFGARVSTRVGELRGGYFWTEVNRPIDAVLQSQTATTQTLLRENLGQIRSRGWTVEADSRTWMHAQLSAGYQYALATVTSFSAQPSLVGNWIPQVPRNAATAKVQWSTAKVGTFNLAAFYTGMAFDDTNNTDLLHCFARFDAYGERRLSSRWMVYGSVQNLLDRAIEVGRTPLLTLGAPRIAMGGVRFNLRGR
jgi:outer membrane receptor protein involved in Fe transport